MIQQKEAVFINILHLSDIHFGRNNPNYGIKDNFAKHDKILNELIERLSELDDDLKPEHIVFTGDVAWHGKKEEFDEALAWFRKLLSALNLTGKDISFCVGNHDVDRLYKCIDKKLNDYMIDEIDELYKYENMYLLEPAIHAYNEFCEELGVEPYTYPLDGRRQYSYSAGYKDVEFDGGKKVRILSFNTSLLASQDNISEDKMWLGKEQIDSLMQYGIIPPGDDIWYTIALYHHSDRFLHPNETNTYDGRNAPLPTVMEYVDLLLCGHTESCGKPHLTKQRGGGQLLLGGATYYSDDHTNAFSMLYISEKKRSLGFIPYFYEDGWKDYDYMGGRKRIKNTCAMPDEGYFYRDANVILRSGEKSFELPFRLLERNGERIDARKDIRNTFYSRYKDGGIKIDIRKNLKNNVDAILKYEELKKFAGNGENISFDIVQNNGEIIETGTKVEILEERSVKSELLKKLLELEKIYGVRLDIPETVTDSDLKMIDFLCNLGKFGYDTFDIELGDPEVEADGELLESVNTRVQKENRIFISKKPDRRFMLFNIDMPVGRPLLYSGPYSVDISDIERKLETYCPGDKRLIKLSGAENLNTYIVKDKSAFEKKMDITDDAVIYID